ncbi:uncharacterized protein N7446_004467 [Penicillium canescens]|uniref:Uncharacterized protein n=1 Tax=Penicillium canescens TaxID=5083 RepID=A0AAD6I0Z2_PENCN|nr:uncharacterized protein N7446_004467 [Penicillium canescens]KAJ6026930.1 hypothetical protein N7460_011747 [Penicillium canescens]KAJ6067430.1 hypothetical protein N7446_004467 [Penicillium canescens]
MNEPIAVVGSGCRFPGGASSPSALWKLLEHPRDVCQEIPPDRFNTTGFYHQDGARHGATNVKHTYFLQEDVRVFDAAFFNISPNEADSIDPQQRLLLETVYEALEGGGHTLEALRASDTAVYVGTMGVDYHETLLRDLNTIPTYFATGTNRAIISNRVSYFFDWHGPSMTIDTACSSSMIAVHQGVQTLRNRESRVAVVCGTQVILGHEMYIVESKLKMLSPTGRSRMWDADADGYARGEGVAALVLKRLSDAIANGDHIECVIRETGANQDGFSSGITVPNTDAQTALIRQTYAKAGLDPVNNPDHRPQFFEAHGTGTQAGDPKEAAAIYEAFGQHIDAGATPLYVGSVKTVIGHLEGAAGLAGVLKGISSIRNGSIPPNLLFNRLNPRVEPYYKNLHIPTELTPWPTLPRGVPRRVSVNSFGFGGANAHAILEEHVPLVARPKEDPSKSSSLTPFVFSALSEQSLVALLEQYSQYLTAHRDELDASDLAWTLYSRRSQLPVKTAFSARTIQQLIQKIDSKLAAAKENATATIGIRSSGKPATPRILGVFTGQGAQWPAMGAALIRSSQFVRDTIQRLEESLATIPPADRPEWRLTDAILAGADTSRIAEAAVSQPLCTAIQIVLVDLLQSAGLTFASVVGHSSGEIAAAYAAGFISAHDAIRIAYYRGFYARLAINDNNGQKGAMLAVGTSLEDAQELLSLQAFTGRLGLAAHNSPASVTLSGDADAVIQAKKVFDEEKKFARLLKVDTAYHSHHMLRCGDPYVAALRACGIRINRDRNSTCKWFSSVSPRAEAMEAIPELQDIYWRDNMVNTVLFADAVNNAVTGDEQINVAVEVGPHPALQGPASQNIAEVRLSALPYTGLLSRGKDDVEALSDAFGFIWTILGGKGIDLQAYENTLTGNLHPHGLVVGLPSYQWNHGRVHWTESRKSRKIRGRKQAPHELLGSLCPDSNPHDMRWSNLLKVSEIPWLEGHQLQGQTVFPAAGYVAMALEACRNLATEKPVELFELHDLSIPKAITFEEGDTLGVETLVTLTGIEHRQDKTATADFSIYSCPNVSVGSDHDMELMASGTVKISFGTPDIEALFCTPVDDYNMSAVDPDRFYAALSKLGYGYSGSFRGMSSMKRRLTQSSALVDTYPYADSDSTFYLVHPSMLDVAFQSSMLAYSAPGDEHLWSLHVPTAIRSIRVNPEICASLPISGTKVPVTASLNGESESFSASIDIFGEDGHQSMIHVDDLVIKPFAPAREADDRRLFSYTKFSHASPDGSSILNSIRPTEAEVELATACERISYYYVRKWKLEITDDEWANGQPHHSYLRGFVDHTLAGAGRGQHPTLKKEWADDTSEDIQKLIAHHANDIDVQLLSAVGDNIPAAVRGRTTILEHMLPNGMLDNFYRHGLGFSRYNMFLADMMKQVVHRYPHARILEIGAGTGGATKSVLEAVGGTMSSYTYTDISVGFFPRASEIFKEYNDRMTFKVLDAEKTPASQGYEENSYDIVIASNVLHATANLQRTLENTRRLLKPGGYLMLLEITDNDPIRCSTIMGGLPGWWLGVDDGRRYAPTASPSVWHKTLRKAGFGGIDAITPKVDGPAWPFSIIASQAVNDQVMFLRRPLSLPSSPIAIQSLVILGTESLETDRIAEEVADSLGRFSGKTTVLNGLPSEAEARTIDDQSTFINLVDLDFPIFRNITSEKMNGLKRMFERARHVLWVTRGALVEEPYHMASSAFSRSIRNEATHISLNHLDISFLDENSPKLIAEQLLRQCALEEWEHQKLLWTKEPETFLENGKLKIPRLLHDVERNARLNSSRRPITKTVSVADSKFSIEQSATSPLALVDDATSVAMKDDQQSIQVETSGLMALHVASGAFLFLATSKSDADTRIVVALSTTNSSTATPVASTTAVVDTVNTSSVCLHIAITAELLATSLVDSLPAGSSLLVCCSERYRFLVAALSRRLAGGNDLTVTFLSDTKESQGASESSWIRLTARTSRQVVRKTVLRLKPTHFLDLTADSTIPPSYLSLNISETLSPGCKQIAQSDLLQQQAVLPLSLDQEQLELLLADAVARATTSAVSISPDSLQDIVIDVSQISSRSAPHHPTTVVDWTVRAGVKAEVRPLDARKLFSQDKTYILFGLSSQLGQSLCDWMVANGAGVVCLTSRKPKIDQRWLDSFQQTKATVKVFAMDVTDKDSVANIVKTIRLTCPPIAGVTNGAMVLSDALFTGMTFEAMRDVLQPKIDGSYNLDQEFYQDELDFFVLFSSGACVVGNSGQANYAAANGYLNGLARHRRRRGLRASTFDIGLVAGIGYVESAAQHVVDQLGKYGMTVLSESDFRRAFAETILAGYVSAQDKENFPDAVLTTGIRTMTDDETNVVWYANPVFSHCILHAKASETDANNESETKAKALPVTEQLLRSANKEEALELLQESFSAKLRVILQIDDQKIEYDAPLVDLGIDSLVAVEVRSWFLKELKVDVPVLKIVGGATLVEICEQVMKKLPEQLVVKIETGNTVAAPAKSVSKSLPVPSSSVSSAPSPSSANSSTSGCEATPGTETPKSGGTSDSPLTQALTSMEDSTKASTASPAPIPPALDFVKSEPISLGQSRFWFLQRLVTDMTTFNVTFYFMMTGHIRVGHLERAVQAVTARHEALRTCFIGSDTEPDVAYQNVMADSQIKLERKNIKKAEDVAAEYAKLRAHQFDLASGKLLRLILLTLSPTCHYLLVNYHHIVMDGASFQVFISDLEKAYNGQALGSAPRQYPDFAAAQHKALENGQMSDELNYWHSVFPATEEPPVLPLLPMARTTSRVGITNYKVHQVDTQLGTEVLARIKSISKTQRSTPFHFFMAAFKAMLFSFTDAQELTIGIADANRNDSDVINSIGFFLNLLTLKFHRQPDQSFADAILEARTTAYAALEHSRLPFDVLLQKLNVSRSSSYSPFFQAFFDYRQTPREKQRLCNCIFDLQEAHPGRSAYDIALDVTDNTTNAHVVLRVQKGLYDKTAADLLLETYIQFITVLSEDISLRLKDTPLFSEKQLAHGVTVGRGPDMLSDWPPTLPHRIDQIAQENPNKTALMDGHGSSLTYKAMMDRAQAIAEALLSAGAGPSCRILVFQRASADWVCSMLAIMRIGGIYVPLDLRNPISRLSSLAKDCKPTAILVDGSSSGDDVSQLNVALTIDISRVPATPSAPVTNRAQPDSPAAILYTSGSTGTPKGIMVKHSGIRNEMEGYNKTYNLGAERVIQQSAFTFDFSVDQIFTGLVNGGLVYIVPWSKRGDPISITEIIRDHAITYTKVTPSEYSLWMQYGAKNLCQATSWQFAFGGGEPLTKTVLRQFADLGLPQLRVHNSYGPAEISIASHKMEIEYRLHGPEEEGPVSCGYSLPNYTTYVLDKNLRRLPVGMPGEVVIGGAGVSAGYLNNKELTAHHFVPNPYATPEYVSNGWTLMHRTGDIGHLQHDGCLIFRNRMAGDTQVKIRGLRIELRDIETNIIQTAGGALKEAIVTLRPGDPEFLVAHVVFAPQHDVRSKNTFLEHLLGRLPIPQYMIPVLAIPLDELPLTSHHKVDRSAVKNLALPERGAVNTHDEGKLTETMVQLRRVWRQALGKSHEKLGLSITPSTSFFLIGGNSLLAIRLQSQIRSTFNVVIRLVDLLNANTLGQMAREIESSPNVGRIDWDLETAPPPIPEFLVDAAGALSAVSDKEKGTKSVLITGVTGYIGRHLLPLLSEQPSVHMIHCVAVRDKTCNKLSKLISSAKIKIHGGDLSEPLLGLTEDEFRRLSGDVDVILHLGAVRSFWDNYNILRPSNVHPTTELVKLAATRRIPIHFISTSSVLGVSATVQTAVSAASQEPPTDGTHGYIATKWASERILERSSRKLGVPSFIHRFHPSFQPQTSEAKHAVLDEFVRCIDLAGAVPDTTGWDGHIDLVPVQQLCKWLCESILSERPGATNAASTAMCSNIQFTHYESPIRIEVAELKKHIDEQRGGRGLERLQALSWMGRIKALGFAYVLASQETTVENLHGAGEGAKFTSRR